MPRRARTTTAALVSVAMLAVAGCGSGGGDTTTVTRATTVTVGGGATAATGAPLDRRQLERALVTVCGDEVDARTADRAGEFLRLLLARDRAGTARAIDYEIRATGRLADRLRGLRARDEASLRRLVTAVEARRGAWRERRAAFARDTDAGVGGSGSGSRAAVRLLRVGQDTTLGWTKGLEAAGVRGGDCGTALK